LTEALWKDTETSVSHKLFACIIAISCETRSLQWRHSPHCIMV